MNRQLPILRIGDLYAYVDAFAWERVPANRRCDLWLISLLGAKASVRALWARLIKGELGTLSLDSRRTLCALSRVCSWKFWTASLASGYQGVLLPEIALYTSDATEFLLMPRGDHETLHYRYLNRRLELPLHSSWAEWLWSRGVANKEIMRLESQGIEAYRCRPNVPSLTANISTAVRSGVLTIPE